MRAILLSLLLMASGTLMAAVQVKVIQSTGYGLSYSEAVQNALIEALKQAEGVSIDSQKVFAKSIQEQALSSSGEDSTHDVKISKESVSRVREVTKGVIHQYSILEAQQGDDGEWNTVLEIQLKKYRTPGISPHKLRKIAVIPFRAKQSHYRVLNRRVDSHELVRQLNQKLVNELTQSRRFSVMDREYMREYLKERNLLLSGNAPLEEQIKVGEALGVDYLLLGSVTEFKAEESNQYIKTLGETLKGARSQINIDFRIMVMATRQIKWSDTIKVKADKELKAVMDEGAQGVIDFMLEKAAQKVVHTSLDNIYPLKILKVAGENSIYINQGGKMTQVGNVYEVYTPGEYVTDPDSGLKIKIDGEQVATVEVRKVQAKYTLAKLIDGDLSQIKPGAILRKKVQLNKKKVHQKVMQPAW